MIFIKLFSLGLIMHEATYFAKDGMKYFFDNSCPTFGIRINKIILALIHACFIIVNMVIIGFPQSNLYIIEILISIQLLTLTAIVISFPLRLSNHLIIAIFVSLGLCGSVFLDQKLTSENFVEYVRYILVIVYAFSCFHKLNSDYFDSDKSCALNLAKLYSVHVGIYDTYLYQFVKLFSVFGIIIAEGVIAILIFLGMDIYGILIALFVHLFLGWLCHTHFSTIMYSLLACLILDGQIFDIAVSLTKRELMIIFIIGIVSGFFLGATEIFKLKRFSKLIQIFFSIYSFFCIYVVYRQFADVTYVLQEYVVTYYGSLESFLFLTILVVIFIVNCISPHIGLKSEFSLNMFSNMRDDNWKHFVIPKHFRVFYSDPFCVIASVEISVDQQHIGNIDEQILSSISLLNHFHSLKFSKYFVYSTLRYISECEYMQFNITVYVDDVGVISMSKIADLESIRPKFLGNFYPFAISIDTSEPHCR